MSVPEQVPYKEYRATGSNNSFEITFYLPDPKDLVVMVNKEIPLVGAYSIQGNTVVFNTPPNEGDLVELTRDTQLDRETEYKSYDNSFRPETINFDLDKIWLVLQESNLVDAKILARLKQEIEWRRTHDFNYDELAQVREKQLFDALKGYTDTLLASTNPGVFQGVIAGVVFARDGKSIQTHIEEILNNLELNRSYIDEQVGLMAPQGTTYNKVEVDTKINAEATRAQVAEQVLQDQVNAVGVGNKAYLTYDEMDADKANNPINSKLEVTNDPDPAKNGTYQWNGTTLTKSAYDPVELAKNYTDTFLPVLDSVRLDVGADANSLVDNGKYIIGTLGSYLNFPVSSYGVLDVVSRGQTVTQTFHATINNRYFYRTRYAGVWNEWKEAQSKVEIEALIAASMAGLRVNKITQPPINVSNPFDANTVMTDQIVIINTSSNLSNLPYNTQTVLIANATSNSSFVTQIALTLNQNRLLWRTYFGGTWRDWKEAQSKVEIEALISTAASSTLASAKAYTDNAVADLNGLSSYVEKGLLTIDKDNKLVDANAVKNIAAFFGSSTIFYMQDQLESLFSSYGYTTNIKDGQGGEYIENTGARFGSFDCMINPVTIPASGAVNVVSNMPVVTALKAFSGTLGGVKGTLNYSAANTSLVFTRTTSGSEIVLPSATQFIPDVDENMYGGVLIINVGKNNLTNSSAAINNVDEVFNKTVDFVNKMSNVFKRVLILDHFVNSDASQYDSATRINQYNAKLYEKYDGLTIRVNEYITGDQVWIDTGITPTTTDLEQQSRGEKPTSLSRDGGHLNATAEAAIISNLIQPKLEVFQWI